MGFGLSLAFAAVLAGATTPSGVELEYVVDNQAYQPPGLPGQFFIERTFPLSCGGSVVFAGITETTSGSALYAATPSGVEVVANELTPMAGTPYLFHRAEEPFCDDGRIYFAGRADLLPQGVVGASTYSWRPGGPPSLELAAPLDFGLIEAYSFINAYSDGGDFVVRASLRQEGSEAGSGLVLKRQSQSPELIFQDFTQVLPGQAAPPLSLGGAVLRGDEVSFVALHAGGYWGLYQWSAARGFSLLLDNQAVQPEIGGSFHSFAIVAAVEEGLLIGASFRGGEGIFLLRGDGGLETRMRTGDLTTEGQAIRHFEYIHGDASFFTFYGSTVDAPLFVDSAFLRTPDGRIQRILTSGETIGGQPVFYALARASGREVAVLVDHGATLATTIYRMALGPAPISVEVPTLSEAALAALAAALAFVALVLLRRR